MGSREEDGKLEVGRWKFEVGFCCFRMRTCIPEARAGRPLGSWGPSLGSHPGPNYKAHLVPWTPWIRIKIDVEFYVVFESFCARVGVPLGNPLDTFWRLVRAKLVPKPSSNHLLVKKVVVHKAICFPMVVDVFSPHVAPQNDTR